MTEPQAKATATPVPRVAPAGVLTGALRVMGLALRTQTFERRMLLPLALLCVLPLVALLGNPVLPADLSQAQLGDQAPPPGVAAFHRTCARPLLGAVTLLTTLLLATGAMGDEFERRTLVHLMIRPIPRGAVYLGKLGWIIATAWGGLALSGTITLMAMTTGLGGEFGADYLRELLIALALAVAVYSALFFALSLLLPFPTFVGLAYGFGLELIVGRMPGQLAWISVGYHVRSILDHRLQALPRHAELVEPQVNQMFSGLPLQLTTEPPELTASLALLGATLCLLLAFGWALMLHREFAARLGRAE